MTALSQGAGTGGKGDGSRAVAGSARSWRAVVRDVASGRIERAVFLASALAVGVGYSILLPFDETAQISVANWRFLDARYLFFSAAFAVGVAWVLTVQVHAMRRIARAAAPRSPSVGGPASAFAVVVGLLPSLACCSPVVPTLVGLLGLSAASSLRTTGRVQYFLATQQDWLLGGALALLLGSALWATRKLARADCHAFPGCATLASAPRGRAGGHEIGEPALLVKPRRDPGPGR